MQFFFFCIGLPYPPQRLKRSLGPYLRVSIVRSTRRVVPRRNSAQGEKLRSSLFERRRKTYRCRIYECAIFKSTLRDADAQSAICGYIDPITATADKAAQKESQKNCRPPSPRNTYTVDRATPYSPVQPIAPCAQWLQRRHSGF